MDTAVAPPIDAETCARKILRAKRRARSDLKSQADWERHGHSATFASLWQCDDTVPRVDYDAVSEAEFIERFEAPALPVVIRGVTKTWPAVRKWTVPNLVAHYGERRFRCGEDDDGDAVNLKLKYFMTYASDTRDDSPLYIFDSTFGDRKKTATLLSDYVLPKYFRDDLFQFVGERRRPPYRWIVIGPARSGTNIHIDPLATSAWNTLLSGYKRWVLFPPSAPKEIVSPPKLEDEAMAWFSTVYPRTKLPDWPTHAPIDLLQAPGETVFVPGGWWHVVVNLDMTIAVTQNFCSRTNFDHVWLKTRRSRPKFAEKLLEQLRTLYPDLYRRATDDLAMVPDMAPSSSSSSSSSTSSSSDGDVEEQGEDERPEDEEHEKESAKRERDGASDEGCEDDEDDDDMDLGGGGMKKSKRRSRY